MDRGQVPGLQVHAWPRGALPSRVSAKCFIYKMITGVLLARKQQARAILIKIRDFQETFYLIELLDGWLASI